MKKSSLMVLPFALALLAGCNGDNGGKMQVIMWHNSNDTTANLLANFEAAFEKENPDVDVILKKQTGGYDVILDNTLTGLSAQNKGDYPDIFLGYPDSVAQLLMSGKVVDLDTYINDPEIGWTDEDKADFIETYVDEGKHYAIPGTYSLPYAKSTEALYYNKDLLGVNLSSIDSTINAGQPLNETYLNNLTWEEFFGKLCPALVTYNAAHSNSLIDTTATDWSILNWSSDDNAFITLCEQYGLPYTTFDANSGMGSPAFNTNEVKNMMKYFQEQKTKHYFGTKKSHSDKFTNTLFTKKQALFDIGSTGGGQYYAGDNNKNVDVRLARIPQHDLTNPKIINQGPSLAILKHGNDLERVKAAWKFYNFIVSKKNCAAFSCTTGYSPIRNSVYDTELWAEYLDGINAEEKSLEMVYALIAKYSQNVTDYLFSSPVFNGSAVCRKQVEGLFGAVIKLTAWNDSTVQELMDNAWQTAKLSCY